MRIGKIGGTPSSKGGIFKFESGLTWRSPELELNDIGFLLSADEINHFTWAGYQIQKPFSIFRNWRINYNHWLRWDFSGKLLYTGFNTNTHGWFKNNWRIGTGMNWNPLVISNNALRGGSSLRRPSNVTNWAYVETDDRKKVSFSVNTYFEQGAGNTERSSDIYFGVNYQPFDALRFSLFPEYNHTWRKQDQYVDAVEFGNQQRIVVSEVEQRSFSLTARLNYNITPDLTIQYYAQPFIFRAKYQNFGYVADPLNRDFDARFHRYDAQEVGSDGAVFRVDENRDGTTDYTFSKPDFNFIQYRSNLVVRWEYIPGSEVYLVWSQGNVPNANTDIGTPLVRSLFDNAFGQQPQNIFLLKFTYRFLL